jgi:hypothetical protein
MQKINIFLKDYNANKKNSKDVSSMLYAQHGLAFGL